MSPRSLRDLSTAAIPSEYQTEVLGYLVQDGEVMSRFSSVLSEHNFENPVHRIIFKLVREYFIKYSRVCSRRVLERELEQWLRNNEATQYAPAEFFWKEVERVYAISTEDRRYLIDRVSSYVIRHNIAKLAEVAHTAAEKETPDIDQVTRQVQELYTILSGRFQDRKEYLLKDADKRERGNPALKKIPTGLPSVDRVLGGGLAEGELGVIMAPTGRGKSFWLTYVGSHALQLRKKILHITLEISRPKVIARYESYQSRIKKISLHEHGKQVTTALRRVRRLVEPGDVIVIEYPRKMLTIDELRAVVTQVIVGDGFRPDLLILDYADLLRPQKGIDSAERKHEMLTSLYERLAGIAQEFKIPLWTGSQSSRLSFKMETITIEHISESFGKAMVADVIIGFCMTKDEEEKNEGRLYIDKNRDNKGHVMVPIRCDFDIARFWEAEGTVPIPVVTREVEYDGLDDDDYVPF